MISVLLSNALVAICARVIYIFKNTSEDDGDDDPYMSETTFS
jgi:hypothetical protein